MLSTDFDSWLITEGVLSVFSKKRGTAPKKYSEFVSQGKNQPSPWESLKNQVFLGAEEYVSQILGGIDKNQDLSEIPKSQRKEKAKELAWYEKQAMSRNEAIKHSFELLDKEAYKVSDNQAADQMNLAKKRLFKQINEQKKA